MSVTEWGMGCAPLGELFDRVSDDQAQATLSAAWESGVRFFDTAPLYGMGLSERRVGDFLRRFDATEYVLSTKVGRLLRPRRDLHGSPTGWAGGLLFESEYDYTYSGIMRSYEDSLQRLGLPKVHLLVIHDLDRWTHGAGQRHQAYLEQLATSGHRALEELRDSGDVVGVGAGVNEIGLTPRLLTAAHLDFLLVAMRYTLLEHEPFLTEMTRLADLSVGLVVGAVFNSGILATGSAPGAKFNYGEPSEEILQRMIRLRALCDRFGVSMPAAALQFPLAHPAVASVIPGATSRFQVAEQREWMGQRIPSTFWETLVAEGLISSMAPVPA